MTATPKILTPTPAPRKIVLKASSASHREAVRLVAATLQTRSEANAAISLGLATGGTRAVYGAILRRRISEAQPSLKAARAELAHAELACSADAHRAKLDRITGRFEHFFGTYSYLTKRQVYTIHAHEGWGGR